MSLFRGACNGYVRISTDTMDAARNFSSCTIAVCLVIAGLPPSLRVDPVIAGLTRNPLST